MIITKERKIIKKVMPTEVYSRCCGYYRPVDNWNLGKQQEFKERNGFDKSISGVSE